MRTRRKLFLVVVTAAVLAAGPTSSMVRAEGAAVRSGTIVSGTGQSPANPWVMGMEGCIGAPTCLAWLQAPCDGHLVGQDPALHASIVDVATLAGTERSLTLRRGVGINWGRVIVQFWSPVPRSRSGTCEEIPGSRLGSEYCLAGSCRFRVPAGARWMTITSSPDNMNISWTLT